MERKSIKDIMVSPKQIDYMKHAIGLCGTKIKKRKYVPYRNYFYVGSLVRDSNWEYLIEQGLATRTNDGCYKVSKDGLKLLEIILKVKIEVEE